MYAKLIISGELEVLSGLHIGSGGSSRLKAADATVVRDGASGLPYIPGSTLKGKLRTLLSRAMQNQLLINAPERDPEPICRLFGAPACADRPAQAARLIISDAALVNASDFSGRALTEIKMETAVDRASGCSLPRSVERVVPGARFALRFIYDATVAEEVAEDLQNLAAALELLAMDYLGGHGTRGSGRVAFRHLKVRQGYGDVFDEDDMAILNGVFDDASLNL